MPKWSRCQWALGSRLEIFFIFQLFLSLSGSVWANRGHGQTGRWVSRSYPGNSLQGLWPSSFLQFADEGLSCPQYPHWQVIFLTCTQCCAITKPHNYCCLARNDKFPVFSISLISIYHSCGILLLADELKWTKTDTNNELIILSH